MTVCITIAYWTAYGIAYWTAYWIAYWTTYWIAHWICYWIAIGLAVAYTAAGAGESRLDKMQLLGLAAREHGPTAGFAGPREGGHPRANPIPGPIANPIANPIPGPIVNSIQGPIGNNIEEGV